MNNYKIAEARTAKGWSQSEFAKRLGTTQQQVARYESGENDVKSSIIVKMSNVLGVTISYLLGLEEPAAQNTDPDFDRLARAWRGMEPNSRAALLAAAESFAKHPGNVSGGGGAPWMSPRRPRRRWLRITRIPVFA